MRHHFCVIAVSIVLVLSNAVGQDEHSLTRDEVALIKKKLVNVLDALGQPPEGYSVDNESFNLPTEAYKRDRGNSFNAVYSSVDRTYGTRKKTKESTENFEKEYQKKIAEAQAKGDYAAITRLAEEMQKKVGEMQLKAIDERKEPISVQIQLNSSGGAVIDPDAVLFEHPGVIALKSEIEDSPGKARVSVYFDPISLKETKTLSRIDLKQPEGGVTKKTAVFCVTIEVSGPASDVEKWAKRVDTKKVLGQIDAAK